MSYIQTPKAFQTFTVFVVFVFLIKLKVGQKKKLPRVGRGRKFVSDGVGMHPMETESISIWKITQANITLFPVIQKQVVQMFPEKGLVYFE